MEIQNIRMDLITPSPLNPRKTFDQAAIEELAGNIEKQGLLQPITVRVSKVEEVTNLETGEVTNIPCFYEIVCGERRYRASSLLKAKEDEANVAKIKAHRKKSEEYQTISCIVREMTDDEAFDAMITENLQRQDVDPIEEAFAFAQLLDKGNTIEDIALRFGKSTRFVFDRVKLNGIIPEYKKKLKDNILPIGAAMMLAKLDEETQKSFLEDLDSDERISTSEVKELIDQLFQNLTSTLWKDDDNWPNGEFIACSECQDNTANHGCLFYEMNNTKNPRCTNSSCFLNKRVGYVLRKIQELTDIVKADEALDFGKTVIIQNNPGPYVSDSVKVSYSEIKAKIEALGLRIVNENECFNGKSWANEEQLKEKIANNEVYRCIKFFEYSIPTFQIVYYNVKRDAASSTAAVADPKIVEADKLKAQLTRNKEIAIEKITEEMRKWAQEKTYFKRAGELSVNEQLAFDVMILRNCTDAYLKLCELSKYGKESDFVAYVRDNAADRVHWHRDFMRNILSSADVMYYKDLQKCQNLIFSEQYPDDYKELGTKIATSLDKKQKRINEKLKELENDYTEEA
ncbi:ParB N-terminal domain-containing protein [Bacteroides sp.]|uniref:ParB/RepB/Spo0J family partition protein n=1 Tax=Bacteroides sp. TaxID=29523 RepID=UPI002615413E|nr:ParB N-terminal domain-containing protein [Bacteroides sp.]